MDLERFHDGYPSGRCQWCHRPMENVVGEEVVMVCVNPECSGAGKVTKDYDREIRVRSHLPKADAAIRRSGFLPIVENN